MAVHTRGQGRDGGESLRRGNRRCVRTGGLPGPVGDGGFHDGVASFSIIGVFFDSVYLMIRNQGAMVFFSRERKVGGRWTLVRRMKEIIRASGNQRNRQWRGNAKGREQGEKKIKKNKIIKKKVDRASS